MVNLAAKAENQIYLSLVYTLNFKLIRFVEFLGYFEA